MLASCGTALVAVSCATSLVVVVLHRTALSETSPRFMGLTGIGPVVAAAAAAVATLGAVLCMAAPAGDRRRRSAGAAAVSWLVVAGLLVVPTVGAAVGPERASGGQGFTLVVQNLWYEHPDVERAATQVLGEAADVVVLVEFTAEHEAALRRAGADEQYPHQWRRPGPRGSGVALLSRLPFDRVGDLGMSAMSLEARLLLDAGPVTLVAVHPAAPSDRWGLVRWTDDHETLAARLARLGPDTVVAGDFNATSSHLRFRRLLDAADLREAHQVAGTGPGLTWPARGLSPPVMRLDHILVGAGVGVAHASVLHDVGADHLGVAARLQFPRS